MSFTIGENYLLKALAAYPYNMEIVCENLSYALSYEDENDMAWTLHGKVMAHQLKDYLAAEESFLQAIALNMMNHEAHLELIWLYIEQARLAEAANILLHAKGIRGADKATLLRMEAVIHENKFSTAGEKQLLSKAIQCLEEAANFSNNSSFDDFLKKELKRVKAKRKRIEKKERKQEEEQPVVVEKSKRNFNLLRVFF